MRKSNFVALARVLASIHPDRSCIFSSGSDDTDAIANWQAVVEVLADWCESQAKPYRGTDGQLKAGFQRDKWIAMCNGQEVGK